MSIAFIGDIAGQYSTLMRLVKKLEGRRIILIGDLVDRGPNSKGVIQWAIDNKIEAVRGNHEDMMIDWYRDTHLYEDNLWVEVNGGDDTLKSYIPRMFSIYAHEFNREAVPLSHIKYLESLPLVIEGEDWIATHAPIHPHMPWEQVTEIHSKSELSWREKEVSDFSVIWNRYRPKRRDKYQIWGHNGKIKQYKDPQGEFGTCIDSSHDNVLSAFLWPEKTFVQEGYPSKPSKFRDGIY